MAAVLAAGTLPWRRRRGALQVAMVHRPRYDDWSWPKGKLDPGEAFPAAAVRETLEETGLRVRLGLPLPTSTYTVGNGRRQVKEVRYWAAEVAGGDGALEHEVDEVAWLDLPTAARRLSYAHDQDQLAALAEADARGVLSSWPLALVRHAKAQPRGGWTGDDWLRPLDDIGALQAGELVPLLGAYDVQRLVTSPSTRAADTLAPFATALGVKLRTKPGLSEEGYAVDPAKAPHHLRRVFDRGVASALCSHGPTLLGLVDEVLARVEPRGDDGLLARSVVSDALETGMAKGEVLLLHVVGTGEDARVVAAERHHPRDRA